MDSLGGRDYMSCGSQSRSEPGYAPGYMGVRGSGYGCSSCTPPHPMELHRQDNYYEDTYAGGCSSSGQASHTQHPAPHADVGPPASVSAAPASAAPRATSAPPADEEILWAKFKQAVVEFAKPLLRGPYERNEISKDGFKLILKKTAEKVVKSYQRESIPPPTDGDIAENQRKKIERLVEEYLKITKKEGTA